MSKVSLMTSLVTGDCSRFLPPQHKTLGRRLFGDVAVVRQDPPMTQNANVVDLEYRRHAVDCQSEMLVRESGLSLCYRFASPHASPTKPKSP